MRGSLAVDLNGVQLPTPVLGRERLLRLRRRDERAHRPPPGGRGHHQERDAEAPQGAADAADGRDAVAACSTRSACRTPASRGSSPRTSPSSPSSRCPVIVSIAGTSVEEFVQVALRINEFPNVVAIEANISCPNVERRNQVFACYPDQASEVIGAMSRMSAAAGVRQAHPGRDRHRGGRRGLRAGRRPRGVADQHPAGDGHRRRQRTPPAGRRDGWPVRSGHPAGCRAGRLSGGPGPAGGADHRDGRDRHRDRTRPSSSWPERGRWPWARRTSTTRTRPSRSRTGSRRSWRARGCARPRS